MSARGFTLIEVLAVLFLTALVLGVALDFFVDLSNESAHASESTRELRRAFVEHPDLDPTLNGPL